MSEAFPLDYLPPYSPDPEPQSRCRPLYVNPRAVRIKGGPLSISSPYNLLTLCEDFVRIVLVGLERSGWVRYTHVGYARQTAEALSQALE
jgi:hypothetical protein